MSPPVDLVRSDAKLPARADVVIIGGGIIGSSAALALAEKGISVALCEKGQIGGEQSSRNWGWCRVMGRDIREVPLALESLKLWRDMNSRVGAETGYREAGIVYLCESQDDVNRHRAWLDEAQKYQVDSSLLSAESLAEVLPGAARPFMGGLYTWSDGRAEPSKAAPAIAEAARRRGAAVLTECAVRGMETRGGRVASVITEKGRIDCDAVVLAGGAWSRLFCGNNGLDLPQLKVLGSVARTAPLEGAPEVTAAASNFAFRKRLDGGYTISQRSSISDIVPDSFRLFSDFLPALGTTWKDLRFRVGSRFIEEWQLKRRWKLDEATPFERVRVLDPVPSARILRGVLRRLVQAFPAFANVQIVERWGGLIDVTPDAVPVIAPVAALPGFHIATGFSGHGFGIGPGAGRLIADIVAGDTPIVNPAPFRLERFARSEKRAAA